MKVITLRRRVCVAVKVSEILFPVKRRIVQVNARTVNESDSVRRRPAIEQMAIRDDGLAHDLGAATAGGGLAVTRIVVAVGAQERPL